MSSLFFSVFSAFSSLPVFPHHKSSSNPDTGAQQKTFTYDKKWTYSFTLKMCQNRLAVDFWGTLKTRDWKMQDWKTWDQIAGVENAGLENAGLENTGT